MTDAQPLGGRPRIAAFPKAFFDQLIARSDITVEDFIRRSRSLGLEGVELYPSFLRGTDDATIARLHGVADDVGVELPMMCSSPDFVNPLHGAWERAVEDMHELVDVMAELGSPGGWRSVRVLSGQAWPDVPEVEGITRAVEGIKAVLSYAASKRVWVVIENHYKDGLWTYPEFAQSTERFLGIINQIASPWFGINFDPSNALVVGEDPLSLLNRVVDRVRCVGASDRWIHPGYGPEDLRAYRGKGYPDILQHDVVGQGQNDYPAILCRLANAGFVGWISIEDGAAGGEQGFADIAASAQFLGEQIDQYWPAVTLSRDTGLSSSRRDRKGPE
jgi:sugar phosphate isomerase/epimerase